MPGLRQAQVAYLLRGVQPHRVAQDDQGHSHLPQQDVRAHLTRVFGFGNWGMRVTQSECIFEDPVTWDDRRSGKPKSGWDVCYSATVLLTVRDPDGNLVTELEDVATGDAQHQTRMAGHDLALKSAVSTALKRAATGLGDQFGLSLYNRGSMAPFVQFTLAPPAAPATAEQTPEPAPEDVPAGDPEEARVGDDGEQPEPAQQPERLALPAMVLPERVVPAHSSDHGDLHDPLPELSGAPEAEPATTPLPGGTAPPLRQAQAASWNAISALHEDWTQGDRQLATIALLRELGTNVADATADHWLETAARWNAERTARDGQPTHTPRRN